MTDFQQKRKIKKILYSKTSFFILCLLVFFLGKATYNIYQKQQLSSENYAIVKKNYESLKTRKEMLDSEISRLKTDSGIEEEIRGKFSVAKPGEMVVIMVDSSTSAVTEKVDKGFWSSLLEKF